MAPERVNGDNYSFKSDVWGAGMVMYELSTGVHPFSRLEFVELYDQLCEQPEPRLVGTDKDFPSALCDFVAVCLTRDESKRPDAKALLDHEVISSHCDRHVTILAEWLSELSS